MSSDSYCPYCYGAKSMLLGDIYCSQQQHKSMREMENGTLLIRSLQLEETAEHISRLSIRCMLKGQQHYRLGNNDYYVHSKNFLLVNEGQSYKTSFHGSEEQEMFLVAFQPGFAEGLLHALTSSTCSLLDAPYRIKNENVHLFEKTYEQDTVVLTLLRHLRQLIDADIFVKKIVDFDSIYTALLTRIFHLQGALKQEIDKLSPTKPSTRIELFRRLSIAKDYIDAHSGDTIQLKDIANAACLSVHHFKRAFKSLYGETPHHYLMQQRINKAKRLLKHSGTPINELSWQCGFQDTSSFIRQFKKTTGVTPNHYRIC